MQIHLQSASVLKAEEHLTTELNQKFKSLQQQLHHQFLTVFPDKLAAKTVIVIPSLTLDQEILSKVKGHFYYEERLLCLLMLLRMPRTQIIYVPVYLLILPLLIIICIYFLVSPVIMHGKD